MKKLALVFGLIALGLPSASFAAFEDVAINPRSGDTFIIERTDNPTGELLILNDHDEGYRRTQSLVTVPAPGAKFEIELSRPGLVTYLIQADNGWMLNGVQKGSDGEWQPLQASAALSGMGDARGLTSLPDGRVAVTIQENSVRPAQILVIDPASEASSAYRVLDVVAVEAIQQSAARIMNVSATSTGPVVAVENEGDAQYGSSDGVGFGAGMQGGLGIAYRKHLENKWGIQFVGIGFGGNSSWVAGDLGVTLMRTLSKTQYTRFYALAGASIFYNGVYNSAPVVCTPTPDGQYKDCAPSGDATWGHSTMLNFGLGIGMEFTLAKNLGLALELPLTLMMYTTESGGLTFNGVYPIPNLSLIYYF